MSSAMQEPIQRGPRTRLVCGRPRFVVALVAAAVAGVIYEILAIAGFGDSGRTVFTVTLNSGQGAVLSAVLALFYAVSAVGLWRGRAWARKVVLTYLMGLLATTILFWNPGGHGASAALGALAWQVSTVPLLTFAMMFLWGGERWFR